MRLTFAATALLAASALPLSGLAEAKTVRYAKSARSGATVKIDHYTGWNNDCSFLEIKVDVVKKPAHGTVTPKIAGSRITKAEIGSARNCLGKPTKVIEVYYRSKKGYRGKDPFTVQMRTPNSAPVTFVYDVTVR